MDVNVFLRGEICNRALEILHVDFHGSPWLQRDKGNRLIAIRMQRDTSWDINMHHFKNNLLNPRWA